MTRPIFFLTDFGLADTYVGVVKAVILGIAPDARIVDLTHDVLPRDVRAGAFALLTAVPYLPEDAVVLAVVDPGVGTARRPVAVQAGGRTFVGPDNGLFSWAIGRAPTPDPYHPIMGPLDPHGPVCGDGEQMLPFSAPEMTPAQPMSAPRSGPRGEVAAVALDRPGFWRPTVSATFHGRDLFGPVAAHLAMGFSLAEVGTPVEAIQTIPWPNARRILGDGGQVREVHGEVIHVDRFGNLISNLTASDLPADPGFQVAGREITGLSPHFQPSGDATAGERLIALVGSSGLLEIAVPNGSAADVLGTGVGAAITVSARS